MSQQINLFNPVFLKQKKYFSALTMAQGLAMILLGSIAVVVYARLQLTGLEREAVASAAQLKATKAQLAKVSAAYAPRDPSKELEAEIQRLEGEIHSQRQAYDLVRNGGFGNSGGYSEYFRAFSRQIVSGLWLTGFDIVGSGSEIALQGRALQGELVPVYLSRLKKEPVMKGKSFAELSISEPHQAVSGDQATDGKTPSARANFVEFSLSSSSGMSAGASDKSGGEK